MEQKTLNDYLQEALYTPMQIKGKEGATIMPMDAIAKALLNNAVKGDVPSILTLQNMMRKPDPEGDRRRSERREAMLTANRQRLEDALRSDCIYMKSLDIEIGALAQTLTLISDIEEQMQQPGFQNLLTDFQKNGTTTQRLNPLIELRDKYQAQFKKEWQELRNDALRRKMMKR